jgi:ABC-type phosphate/phosphonate transport system substrate-binding protein
MTTIHATGLLLLTVTAGGALLGVREPAPAAETLPAKTVQIGLVKSLFRDTPESLIQVLAKPLKTLMEAQTGLTGQLQVAGDANNLGQQLHEAKVQLGVFHGFEFAWARQKYTDLKALVIAVSSNRVLHANLVVHRDSKAECCADLKGTTLAIPRTSREHCHLFLERRCPGAGEAPRKFFGCLTTPATIEDALDDVVDGMAQAAILDSLSL